MTPRTPLDVGRLARALHATARRGHIGLLPDLTACTSADVHREDAAAIAREYAALEEPTPEEPTPPRKPAWVGVPDANGDIHCSRLAPQRCMWLEGHYGGCATP